MTLYTSELTAEKDGISKEIEIGFKQMAKAANKVLLEQELEVAIENKDTYTLNDLGRKFFDTNEYVDQNLELATRAFQHSMEFGSEDGLYCLADLYQIYTVDVDDEVQVATIKKAAYSGYKEALFFMAWRYKTGDGLEQDHDKAMLWFEKALINDSLNMQKLVKEMGNDDYKKYKDTFPYKYYHVTQHVA